MRTGQISATHLTTWVADIFAACAVPAAPARQAAEILVRTNLRGVDTHGVARLPPYAAMLLAGEMDPAGMPRIADHGPILDIDARHALGQVAGPQAVAASCARARRDGVAVAVLRDVGHLGALGVLLLQAAEQGLVGFMAQSGPPVMGLAGSLKPAIGNNPLAFAAPSPDGGAPVVVDMATSAVAQGRLIEAARAGREIPADWAIDAEGRPTTDPAAALRGMLMPMAGHKGIGLAMMVEVLAGALTGVRPELVMTEKGMKLPPAFGGFLLVLDPEAFGGRQAFDAYLRQSLSIYAASGPHARYPGQGAAVTEAERREHGIPIGEALAADLTALGERLSVSFPAPLERPR